MKDWGGGEVIIRIGRFGCHVMYSVDGIGDLKSPWGGSLLSVTTQKIDGIDKTRIQIYIYLAYQYPPYPRCESPRPIRS